MNKNMYNRIYTALTIRLVMLLLVLGKILFEWDADWIPTSERNAWFVTLILVWIAVTMWALRGWSSIVLISALIFGIFNFFDALPNLIDGQQIIWFSLVTMIGIVLVIDSIRGLATKKS